VINYYFLRKQCCDPEYSGFDFFHPRSGSATFIGKELRFFYPKIVLCSRKYDLISDPRIRMLFLPGFRIPDSGAKKALDPGSGSATLPEMNDCNSLLDDG
jgi:hypothetical protein